MQSLSELEQFRGAIPADLHRAWSQRAQHYIVDGSPIWQVHKQQMEDRRHISGIVHHVYVVVMFTCSAYAMQVFVSCPVLPTAEASPTFSAIALPPAAAAEVNSGIFRQNSAPPPCITVK